MSTYMICRRCGGTYPPSEVATAASKRGDGWLAIVCDACGEIHRRDRLGLEYGFEPGATWVDGHLLGALAIDQRMRAGAHAEAMRLARRAASNRDRRTS